MASRKGSSTDLIIALAVFVGVLVVYVLTLCPTVYPGQSLEAVVAATKTGVIRSVDYPVWRFVGRVFMGLSSNKAYVLNLVSAIFGAATIGLLYRLFSRFGHARTHDELTRFRGQPNLARWAALSAALLVAFSHTFWRASVTAGTDALNAFMLMLVTHFLVRYRETRKKRYFMAYAIVYSVALANFPTMLLLLPIYLVLSIMWCREAYADLVVLGATILISAVLFGFAVFQGPVGFAAAHRAEYFRQPLPITRPMFDYVSWYWGQMRAALPMGGMGVALSWLLALVLPTFPPVLYLAFTKPERRGGEMGRASTITDGIFRFLAFAYTAFGIMALFDFASGPYVTLRTPQGAGAEGFLVVYMVVGAWVCYMLGYWALMLTSRPATSPEGRRSYSRPAYAVLVAVLLVLPAANLVKHVEVDHSGLNGFTLVEDFARDTITSATSGERNAVLLVYDNWGSLLRYVHKHRVPPDVASKVQIVDVAASEGLDNLYLDKHAYLSVELLGQAINPELDPGRSPNLTATEAALSYMRLSRNPRDVFFTDDRDRFDVNSELIAYSYDLVPQGLVYRLVSRRDVALEPEDLVASGRALWSTLRLWELKARPLKSWPLATRAYLLRASKLANDFGVYCNKYADADVATGFYRKALGYYDMDYSAIRNLQIADAAQSPPRTDEDLKNRLNEATLELGNTMKEALPRYIGPGASEGEQEKIRKYLEAYLIMGRYGLVRDPALLKDFVENHPSQAAVNNYDYAYGFLGLAALVDPKGGQRLLQRAALTVRQQGDVPISDLVGAVIDAQSALADLERDPSTDDKSKAGAYYIVGLLQARLRNYDAAEAAIKRAIELNPDLWDARTQLAALYAATKRVDEATAMMTERVELKPPADAQELFDLLRNVEAMYRASDTPDGLADFARRYAAAHKELGLDAMLYALDRTLAQGAAGLEKARPLYDEVEKTYGATPRVLVRKAQLASMEQRYGDVLTIEVPTDQSSGLAGNELLLYLFVRGTAFYETGEPVKALEDMEQVYKGQMAAISASVADQEAAAKGNQRVLSALQQWANRQVLTVHAQYAEPLAAASFQAWAVLKTPDSAAKALQYAASYRDIFRGTAERELEANAAYGWAVFKINGDTKLAREYLERAYLAFPNSSTPKVRYGAILIAEGDTKGGLALLQKVLDEKMKMSVYDKAEAERLVEQYRAHLETTPEGAVTPGETGATEEPAGSEEPATSGESDTPTEPSAPDGTGTTDTGTTETGTTDTGTTDTGTDTPISE